MAESAVQEDLAYDPQRARRLAAQTKQAETRALVMAALTTIVESDQPSTSGRFGLLSIKGLSRISGVSTSSIYNHFGSLRGVAEAVVNEDLARGREPHRAIRELTSERENN